MKMQSKLTCREIKCQVFQWFLVTGKIEKKEKVNLKHGCWWQLSKKVLGKRLDPESRELIKELNHEWIHDTAELLGNTGKQGTGVLVREEGHNSQGLQRQEESLALFVLTSSPGFCLLAVTGCATLLCHTLSGTTLCPAKGKELGAKWRELRNWGLQDLEVSPSNWSSQICGRQWGNEAFCARLSSRSWQQYHVYMKLC